MSGLAQGYKDGPKIIATRPRRGMAAHTRGSSARSRTKSAEGYGLRGAVHSAGVYFAVPGHRPAGFRTPRDRLCAGPVATGVEVPKAVYRQFPKSRRIPRRLHGGDRQKDIGGDQAEMAARRRLLVSARRHPDRRVLADRQTAEGSVDSRSGRRALSGAGMISLSWRAASSPRRP